MKKLTIEKMNEIAKERGGICISTHYVNRHTKLIWQCAKKHKWSATPFRVKQGTWCPRCAIEKRAQKLRLPLEEVKKIAIERDGKCLTQKYINAKTPIKWECKYGHQWKSAIDGVKYGGAWCPVCAGNKKLTIGDMQKLAQKRGGKCLSNRYFNCKTKLSWQCKNGHKWQATLSNIRKGTWCPTCAKKHGIKAC